MSLPWFLFLLCLLMGLGAWLVFWWSVRTGQFQEADGAAAEMLELDRADTVPIDEASPAHELHPPPSTPTRRGTP